jgi:tetratricopeptide (TPR) repeat protein
LACPIIPGAYLTIHPFHFTLASPFRTSYCHLYKSGLESHIKWKNFSLHHYHQTIVIMKSLGKQIGLFVLLIASLCDETFAQALRIPGNANIPNVAGRKLGATQIMVKWNAPGVKGREGKIWGTDIAPYGFTILGYGSDVASPWRAGADECTVVSFSTPVTINGKNLPEGEYALFIALSADSCQLIFNRNTAAWGAYFYDASRDVMRVTAYQQKNQPQSQERLNYVFDNQTNNAVELALVWERWRIPFTIGIDYKATVLADIQRQMSGSLGFDPPSLEAAAGWCLGNEVNYAQALGWINSASDPQLGGRKTFNTLFTKAGLLEKMGNVTEANSTRVTALEVATATELHQYGRRLLSEGKKEEAFAVFEKNFKQQQGKWPTQVGMMRAYAGLGNYKKALEHAKLALVQAPDELNKKSIADNIGLLEKGQPIQ